jgi:hypothetical protein
VFPAGSHWAVLDDERLHVVEVGDVHGAEE